MFSSPSPQMPQMPQAPAPPPAFGTVQSPQKKQSQGGFSSTVLGNKSPPPNQLAQPGAQGTFLGGQRQVLG